MLDSTRIKTEMSGPGSRALMQRKARGVLHITDDQLDKGLSILAQAVDESAS
jgi:hypothetical protein